MRTLLKIVQRYSNFLVFLALEVAAFMLINRNNAYPRSSMFSTANSFIAWQYEQISAIGDYFSLQGQNEALSKENAELRNRLSELEAQLTGDSIRYKEGKVVQMTTKKLHNYLTINRGSRDGLVRGQGVINGDGVVGIVRTVGQKYSIVLPLINTHTNLSCRFAKNDYVGILQWDGKDCRFAQLTDVATHIDVQPGDTIVTSGLSSGFPGGIPVGIVENCSRKEGDSYYTIRVRLQVDFKRLRYIEVVQNMNMNELEELRNGLD
jgi:rod shape-determining protein MreC